MAFQSSEVELRVKKAGQDPGFSGREKKLRGGKTILGKTVERNYHGTRR